MKPKTVIKEDEDLDKAGIISIDDFAKVKLRTGEITACEKIKKSKKLLKIQVDDARGGRQIVSGIAEYYRAKRSSCALLFTLPRSLSERKSYSLQILPPQSSAAKKATVCFLPVTQEKKYRSYSLIKIHPTAVR